MATWQRWLSFGWVWMGCTFLLATDLNITPVNPQGWAAANVRSDASVAITGMLPRAGDGSIQFQTMTVTPGQDKADFQLTWNPDPLRTMGSLDEVSYEYYRDSSSTTGANFHPVLRLFFYLDQGTPNLADDIVGLFIFEEVYQVGGSVPLDTWDFNDLLNQRFWMFISVSASGTGVVQNYGMTLNDWMNNLDPNTSMPPVGLPGDPTPPTLSAGTAIVGVNVGVGSGWGANFLGYVDNVRLGFGGTTDTYNFNVVNVPVELMQFTIE